jgi:hypothetical protein
MTQKQEIAAIIAAAVVYFGGIAAGVYVIVNLLWPVAPMIVDAIRENHWLTLRQDDTISAISMVRLVTIALSALIFAELWIRVLIAIVKRIHSALRR